MPWGTPEKYVIIGPSLLLKHTPLSCFSEIAIYTKKKIILLGKRKFHGSLICLSYLDG